LKEEWARLVRRNKKLAGLILPCAPRGFSCLA
jgi:hypothetical protein